MTTPIVKWGNSRGIRIPKPFLENLNLQENDLVDILVESDRIIIKRASKHVRKTTKQRVEEFYSTDFETALKKNAYEFTEMDCGEPVGSEIW